MLIAHVSDFHIFAASRETLLVRADAADVARKIVKDIASFNPTIEAVMLTGDVADGGSPADYALVKDILAPLRVPVFVVPGNHDDRAGMRAAFGDTHPFEDGEFLHYEARLNGLRILGLDTLVPDHVYGHLCARRIAWVEERLRQPSDGLTLILMHHPPFRTGIVALDSMGLVEGAERLGELVAAQRGPVRILSGHIHRPVQAPWNGAFAAIGGSPAFQVALDLDPAADEPGIVTEPYAWFVHNLDPDAGLALHPRFVRI